MKRGTLQAIVIGASAGALEALSTILPDLPADYPLPVMLVVHQPPDKESILAELLQAKCRIRVVEVEDKQPIQPGTLYLAPPDYHLLVEKTGCLSLSNEEPILFSRPSIDVLSESAADAYEDTVLGVVLTGANDDGANGLHAICANGGKGLVQEPATAFAQAMPRAAVNACPGALAMCLQDIALYLQEAPYICP